MRRSALILCTVAISCGGNSQPPEDSGTQCQPVTAPTLFSDTGTYLNEYYVDHDRGDDTAAGTQSAPWHTFARASMGRQPGDRVHIGAGTYFECFAFDGLRGTATNPITFVGEGDVRIVCMDGEAASGSGVAYLTLDHLNGCASAPDTNAVHIDGGSDHVVIRHVEVASTGAGGDCIKINATDNVWITDNDLHNADSTSGSAQGIDMVGVHHALIARNHVHDLTDTQGIFAKGGSSDIVIEQNLVERLTSNQSNAIGIVVGGVTDRQFFTPIDADYEAQNVIARNNIVIGADGGGIGADGCHDCSIVNNTLWNTGHAGYAIPMTLGATGMNAATATSTNVNLHVQNNLVGNPFGTMRAPIQAEPPERMGLLLSNNWWWNGPRDDVFDPGYNHDVGVDEPHSFVDIDPQVVNGEGDPPDVHLMATSGARGAGATLDIVTDDFNGHCRMPPLDIGALRAQ